MLQASSPERPCCCQPPGGTSSLSASSDSARTVARWRRSTSATVRALPPVARYNMPSQPIGAQAHAIAGGADDLYAAAGGPAIGQEPDGRNPSLQFTLGHRRA